MNTSKNLIARALLALALVAAPGLAACSTATVEAPASSEQATQVKVSMSIDGTVAGGTTETMDVEVPEGATVYDALLLSGVDHELVDSSYGPYVAAINGIGENATGSAGGWTFTVNGEMPDVGVSEVTLAEGDTIAWSYVTF